MVLYLRDRGEHVLAAKLDACAPYPAMHRCHKPWLCDSCWIADTFKVQTQVLGRAFYALTKNPDLIFFHASLGVGTHRRWQDGDAAIRDTFRRLGKGTSKVWSLVSGGAWIKEFEHREAGGFAPHVHMLMVLDPAQAPRWWKSPGFAWARAARRVLRPDVPFDPSHLVDPLLAELVKTKEVRPLWAYGLSHSTHLPTQCCELEDLYFNTWDLMGYMRKSRRVARSGGSRETRRMSRRTRLALHKARISRRGVFGTLRCGGHDGIEFAELGTLIARALRLGPFSATNPATESGRGIMSPLPSQATLAILDEASVSPNESQRGIANAVLATFATTEARASRSRFAPRPSSKEFRDHLRQSFSITARSLATTRR